MASAGRVRGKERIKADGKVIHPNQKPLALMRRLVKSCSDPGDVVWELFGGLCTASTRRWRLGEGIRRGDQSGRLRQAFNESKELSKSPYDEDRQGMPGGPSVLLAYGKENALSVTALLAEGGVLYDSYKAVRIRKPLKTS